MKRKLNNPGQKTKDENVNSISKTGMNKKFLFLIILLVGIAASLLMFFFVLPGVERSKSESDLNICAYNMKKLITELDNYANFHGGLYPERIHELIENKQIKSIPTCPVAEKDTYSLSYRVSEDRKSFSIYCAGSFHQKAGSPRDFPFYYSGDGFIRKR